MAKVVTLTKDVQPHRHTLYNTLITEVQWDPLTAKFKTHYIWCAFGKKLFKLKYIKMYFNLIDLIV